MAKWHIWDNHGDSTGPHNWQFDGFDNEQLQFLIPQDKKMNDKHLAELAAEWLEKHPVSPVLTVTGKVNKGATLAAEQKNERLAREWALKNEPRRYANPLLRPINGIKADKGLRHVNGKSAILSSSWVGDATFPEASFVNPQQVTFDLGGNNYTFKMNEIGGYKGLQECLSAPSIGAYIATNWIGKLPSSKKNWKTSKSGKLQMPGWLKKVKV